MRTATLVLVTEALAISLIVHPTASATPRNRPHGRKVREQLAEERHVESTIVAAISMPRVR